MNELQCIWQQPFELAEGPVWHELEQALYFVDISASMLHRLRYSQDGKTIKHSWHFPGMLSAVAPTQRNGLLACFADGIYFLDLAKSSKTLIKHVEHALKNNRLNDAAADFKGNFWFGSMDLNQQQNTGHFYCLDRNKNIQKIAQLPAFCITNGPAFCPVSDSIYVTDTLNKTIYKAHITNCSQLSSFSTHIVIPEGEGYPDGMTVDSQGHLWVCHYGGSRISEFNQHGQLVQQIMLPVANITKCAFGGPKLSTLYITTAAQGLSIADKEQAPLSGSIFSLDVNATGKPAAILSISHV